MYSKFKKIDNKQNVGIYEIPGFCFVITSTRATQSLKGDWIYNKICLSKEAIFARAEILNDLVEKDGNG